MRFSLSLLFFLLLSCKKNITHLPMSQGFTSKTSTQIAIMVNKNTKYKYFVLDSKALKDLKPKLALLSKSLKSIKSSANIVVAKKKFRHFSEKAIETIFIKGLNVKKIYNLIVVAKKKCLTKTCQKQCGGFCNVLIDQREFKALDTDKKHVKMAVASCSATYLYDVQKKIWPELLSHKPDVVLLIGDNVYVDRYINGNSVSSKKDIWTRYVEMRKVLSIYQSKQLTPIFAIWDDHDYGKNDADVDFRFKYESKKVFESFFSQTPIKGLFVKGPGISFVLKAFGQRLFFMDNRFFRTANVNDKRNRLRLSKVKYETHWGKKQERWLFSQLQNSNTPSWLIDGGQFFGAYLPWESYEASHPNNFKKVFIKNIQKSKAAVAFISGDRHFFEFIKIPKQELGFTSYEITSSGIHTRLYPSLWLKHFNKRQVFGKTMFYNYAIINSKRTNILSKPALSVYLESWGVGRKLAFKTNFTLFR